MKQKRCRHAVAVAEQWADGLADPRKLQAVQDADAAENEHGDDAAEAAYAAADPDETAAAYSAADYAVCAADNPEFERAAQAELLRCIFVNLFRRVKFKPAWLTSTVLSAAHAIYNDRAFDCLPVLADALEEAGCTNAELLAHCRGPGPHVRGCWVVDLLLGKE